MRRSIDKILDCNVLLILAVLMFVVGVAMAVLG
jgi:hypothetical protein